MALRFVNSSLFTLILLLSLTGLYGLIWPFPGWMYAAHRIFAWALIPLIPWKTAISLGSLKRGLQASFDRSVLILVSLLLAGTALLVVVLGLMWAWRLGPETLWLIQTVIGWHWILALIILPPFALHAWRRWPRPKRAELLSRQGLLRIGALSIAGLVGWWLAERFSIQRQLAAHPRRASGSRLHGYLTGNDFPITTGSGDAGSPIALEDWQLTLGGLVENPLSLTYDELLARPQHSKIALIDCTNGWYSVQRWRGVPLLDLLALAEADRDTWGVRLEPRSRKAVAILPWRELDQVLLATHVGGVPLSHLHGFPLRAVVPSRRGWFWIKWLTNVEVIDHSLRASGSTPSSIDHLSVS